MKKLLLAIMLLLSLNAEAKVIAELANNGNGLIVITNEKCKSSTGMVAYIQIPNFPTLLGCWTYDDDFVHIMWSDGDLRLYPMNLWTMKEKKANI
jgi:hypothetical protein